MRPDYLAVPMGLGTITLGAAIAVYGFIFVCIAMPSLVKIRPQFHFAVIFALMALGLDLIATLTSYGSALNRVLAFFATLMLLAAFALLFLATGGFSLSDLAGDFSASLSELHGTHKTVIVPRTGEQPKPRAQPEPQRESLNMSDTQRPPAPPPPPIPLE
jgi:hypothetical protein